MKVKDTISVLPALYAGWMDSLLRARIPHETRATCDDCAMCAPEGAANPNDWSYFSPRIKCCTYLPALPNYLVGRALEDEDFAFSAGRSTLEGRIEAGVEVTPLGLGQSPTFKLVYEHGPAAFGRAQTLRCPHYLEEAGGRCGVWKHRNAICSTWFCKHERGGLGLDFWQRIRDLLLAIETSLAVWCVLESDLGEPAIEELFPERRIAHARVSMTAAQVDGRAEPALALKLWGNWSGRERDFYRECGRRVGLLVWTDVLRIGGSEVALRARLTRRAFEEMTSDEPPERLTAGPLNILSRDRAGARVVAYSGSDPLDLAPEVLEILPYFDGRPTARALTAIEEELGVRVEKDLLRRLADFEVLVEPARD